MNLPICIYSRNYTKSNSSPRCSSPRVALCVKKISISYQDRISFKLSDHLVGRIREEKPLKIAIALFPENSMGKNNFCMRYLTKQEGKKKWKRRRNGTFFLRKLSFTQPLFLKADAKGMNSHWTWQLQTFPAQSDLKILLWNLNKMENR